MSYPFEQTFKDEFPSIETAHFIFYFYPNSTAEREIDLLKAQREEAYRKIAGFFSFDKDIKITFYLFEDTETKKVMTGHTGMGWAFGDNIVEVYNDEAKLDPYHEIVHIIARHIYGYTIAAFNEGLAVYLSVLLNDTSTRDSLGEPYSDKIKTFFKNGELFSLSELLSFDNIGHSESKPEISYRQSASFVEFMIMRLGKKVFFKLYSEIDNKLLEDRINILEETFGMKIDAIEKYWLNYVL